MMVKLPFMFLCKALNFTRHKIYLQVPVEGIIPNVPGCITMFLSPFF